MDEMKQFDFSNVSVQILQRECEALRNEVKKLENEKIAIEEELETYLNNAAITSAEREAIADEHKKIRDNNANLSEEMHKLDTILKQPISHYKDMKQALDEFTGKQKMLQNIIKRVDMKVSKTERAIETVGNSIEVDASKNSALIHQASTENKGTISTLQTQVKLIETHKKTLESQLYQKTEENKGLTKICEELIRQSE